MSKKDKNNKKDNNDNEDFNHELFDDDYEKFKEAEVVMTDIINAIIKEEVTPKTLEHALKLRETVEGFLDNLDLLDMYSDGENIKSEIKALDEQLERHILQANFLIGILTEVYELADMPEEIVKLNKKFVDSAGLLLERIDPLLLLKKYSSIAFWYAAARKYKLSKLYGKKGLQLAKRKRIKGLDIATLVELYINHIRVLYDLGEREQARKYYKEAVEMLQKDPENALLAVFFGYLLSRAVPMEELDDFNKEYKLGIEEIGKYMKDNKVPFNISINIKDNTGEWTINIKSDSESKQSKNKQNKSKQGKSKNDTNATTLKKTNNKITKKNKDKKDNKKRKAE